MAYMIERIRNDTGINWEKLRIVGFSLGAHIVGYAGRNLRRKGLIVPRITGKIDGISSCDNFITKEIQMAFKPIRHSC